MLHESLQGLLSSDLADIKNLLVDIQNKVQPADESKIDRLEGLIAANTQWPELQAYNDTLREQLLTGQLPHVFATHRLDCAFLSFSYNRAAGDVGKDNRQSDPI